VAGYLVVAYVASNIADKSVDVANPLLQIR
jgi:hypothetical protein